MIHFFIKKKLKDITLTIIEFVNLKKYMFLVTIQNSFATLFIITNYVFKRFIRSTQLSSNMTFTSVKESEIKRNSTSFFDPRPTISNTQVKTETTEEIVKKQEEATPKQTNSAEVFQDVLRKINSLGNRGRQMLRKLMDEIDARSNSEGAALKRLVNETMNDKKLSNEAKRRRRRDLVLSSPMHQILTEEDEDGDVALEEVLVLLFFYFFFE